MNAGHFRALLDDALDPNVMDMEVASLCQRALDLPTDPECPAHLAALAPHEAHDLLVEMVEGETLTPLQVINGIPVWCIHAADQNAGGACEACIASQVEGG